MRRTAWMPRASWASSAAAAGRAAASRSSATRSGRTRIERPRALGSPGARDLSTARPPVTLEAHADPVGEGGRALLGHRDREAGGGGLDLVVRVGGPQHLPVARHGLDHLDGDRFLLVVAEGDLPLDLVEIRADPLPVLLHPIAHHVEGLAHLDPHLLVLRSVLDPVLADELLAARGVRLVHPDLALGQRDPEPVLLAVAEIEVDADLLVGERHAVLAAVVVRRPVVDV